MLLVLANVTIAPATGVAESAGTPPGPFVTLLFSRTEITAADGSPCVRDDRGIATLDGTVAPYLASHGLTATGTIETGKTRDTALWCAHYGETLATSWAIASTLVDSYGWTFASHSATYPLHWGSFSSARIWAETCGSAQTIDDHGLPGAHGLFAWPSNRIVDWIQRDYVSTCFAFGRRYSTLATTQAFATTYPYYQRTKSLNGGACNDASLACYDVAVRNQFHRYEPPSRVIAKIRSLQPGEWYTLQPYLLVTGKSPTYVSNATAWDCTSADPLQHWSNDVERYCWNDVQRILAGIPTTVTVTDPLTVAHAFGRLGY